MAMTLYNLIRLSLFSLIWALAVASIIAFGSSLYSGGPFWLASLLFVAALGASGFESSIRKRREPLVCVLVGVAAMCAIILLNHRFSHIGIKDPIIIELARAALGITCILAISRHAFFLVYSQ